MKKVYKARHGFHVKNNQEAQIIGEEFERIFPDGKMSPVKVLEFAKDPRSPLHRFFEWNDKKAAHEYRVGQARRLILSIVFETDGGPVRSFQNVVIDNERVYLPIDQVSQSEDLINQVIHSIMGELVYFRNKHQRYRQYFGGVFDEIDKAEVAMREPNGKEENKRGGGRGKDRNTAPADKNSKHNDRGRLAAHG